MKKTRKALLTLGASIIAVISSPLVSFASVETHQIETDYEDCASALSALTTIDGAGTYIFMADTKVVGEDCYVAVDFKNEGIATLSSVLHGNTEQCTFLNSKMEEVKYIKDKGYIHGTGIHYIYFHHYIYLNGGPGIINATLTEEENFESYCSGDNNTAASAYDISDSKEVYTIPNGETRYFKLNVPKGYKASLNIKFQDMMVEESSALSVETMCSDGTTFNFSNICSEFKSKDLDDSYLREGTHIIKVSGNCDNWISVSSEMEKLEFSAKVSGVENGKTYVKSVRARFDSKTVSSVMLDGKKYKSGKKIGKGSHTLIVIDNQGIKKIIKFKVK